MQFADLNTSRLNDITGGDPEMNGEIVRMALDDAATAMDRLRSALEERDAASGKALAHQLKGICANVGAERLADAAKRLEHSLGDQDWNAASQLVAEASGAFATLARVTESL